MSLAIFDQGVLKREVSLYCWPPICMIWISQFWNLKKKLSLSYSWFQTSQTGGQLYNDTSPFRIPWFGRPSYDIHCCHIILQPSIEMINLSLKSKIYLRLWEPHHLHWREPKFFYITFFNFCVGIILIITLILYFN